MSQRVIVEFNSDWLDQIARDPRGFTDSLLLAIRNSRPDDETLMRTYYGARVVARRHHSEDVEMKIGIRTVKYG